MHPHGPVAAGGNFIAFDIEEFVGRHIIGQHESAMRLEHGREDDAVENDIVFANEVHQLGICLAPVIGPLVGKFLGGRDITDRRIEPHIQYFSFRTGQGHVDAPVAVAGHGAGLQAAVEPALALPVNIVLPFFMPVDDPFLKPGFVVLQREIPVFCFPLHRYRVAQGAAWVDELLGRQAASAFLALIAIGVRVAANGAGAGDVAIGQEGIGFLIKVLFAFFFLEQTIVV